MKAFYGILKKELLQLIRDIPGLLILFLMPAILLIVITMTQENIMVSRNSGIRVVVVNEDHSLLGDSIYSGFRSSPYFKTSFMESSVSARQAVSEGKFELGIIIPESATEKLASFARKSLLNGDSSRSLQSLQSASGIEVLFDPAIQKIYRKLAVSSLQLVIQRSAMDVFMKYYTAELKKSIENQFLTYTNSISKVDLAQGLPEFPRKKELLSKIRLGLENKLKEPVKLNLPDDLPALDNLILLEESVAKNSKQMFRPDFLQNNIPAFTLFAMFFVVIPLAGSIISEKQQGTRDRLKTLPVSSFSFFSAKVILFLAVCSLQFVFMMAIGQFLLPRLGSFSPLNLHVNYLALTLVVLSAGLAATGFGILIGIFSTTHGQAATFGSVMVVILALLGGIFVPAYMMPASIRLVSILSPLRWGTDAFLSVFGRQTGILSILPEILYLIGFFGIALTIAVKVFNKRL